MNLLMSMALIIVLYPLHGCRKDVPQLPPEENRFKKIILSNDLNEPMELAVAPNGRVYFIERAGRFYCYDPAAGATRYICSFPVLPDTKEAFGNGLLGITIDPDFAHNNYLYFFYTPNRLPAVQRISRIPVTEQDSLDFKNEKIILEFPLELEVSAHTGGSLAWDNNHNLFISTGDNTVPFASNGYAPIDERDGRITFDAQRSAANTNDLRGKVLRIHIEKDGSYAIPDGNLFPKGTEGTRPEIYVMGCRNPYRISVDTETSILYWGEIGPDAGEDGKQGPRGFDEFNQAKKPGYFGWPYFVGNNTAYNEYDFSTKRIGPLFLPEAPENKSVHNTGLKKLPPAQRPMIWYPYNASPEFPQLGDGGRSAMAGPVYHYDDNLKSTVKLPEFFDDRLFIFDWMRNWIFSVKMNGDHDMVSMEQFMPLTGDFRRPIDMQAGADGAMYVLEYGSVYGIDNDDARLVRIEYNAGNRAPVARLDASDSIGIAPLKISFKNKSYDNDHDALTYSWNFGSETSTEENPEHIFTENGKFDVVLTATDTKGEASTDTIMVVVGNAAPAVSISTTDNSTFFFDKTPFHYSVGVKDKEDKTIDPASLKVDLQYFSRLAVKKGHTASNVNLGKTLLEASDCKACHQYNAKSVGPAFQEVAEKYRHDKEALARLSAKVITGGVGVWGDHAMNAHPQLPKDDVTEIVKYVLSLTKAGSEKKLPPEGLFMPDQSKPGDLYARYQITASYKDGGGDAVPLTGRNTLLLRPATVQAEEAEILQNIDRGSEQIGAIHHQSYFVLKNIDLKSIRKITYHYSSLSIDATVEVHIDSPAGLRISSLNYKNTGNWNNYIDATTPIKDPGGKHDLYFVFRKEQPPNQHMFSVDWIRFDR